MTTTVLTANIKVTLSPEDAEDSFRFALRTSAPDIVCLQEWGTNRDRILKHIAASTRLDWTRPGAGVGPIMWDRGRYRLVSSHRQRLARAGLMGRLTGRRTTLPPSYAAVVVLEDLANGDHTVVVNFHLTAEVQYGAGYRTDDDHKARVRRHKREVRTLKGIAGRQLDRGHIVFMAGDTNYHGLPLRPLVSCWEGRSGGTLGSRAVDHVYAYDRPQGTVTIKTDSDHKAVAARYRDEADGPWRFPHPVSVARDDA